MHVIELESGRVGYCDFVQRVLQLGKKSTPRGLSTLDAGAMTTVLYTPYDALPIGVGRRVSRRIAAAEALQLIGAFSDPNLLPPAFDPFKETSGPFTGSFYGAYGVRVGNQLHHVYRKLTDDRHTRQAVVTLWDSRLDNDPGHSDYPCTIALVYRIAQDRLWATTVMRSQDIYRGTPYDWFQFTQLQLSLATVLGVGVGTYTHVTLSTHAYDTDLGQLERLCPGEWHAPNIETPGGLGRPSWNWRQVEECARELRLTHPSSILLTPDELWYHHALHNVKAKLRAQDEENQ